MVLMSLTYQPQHTPSCVCVCVCVCWSGAVYLSVKGWFCWYLSLVFLEAAQAQTEKLIHIQTGRLTADSLASDQLA